MAAATSTWRALASMLALMAAQCVAASPAAHELVVCADPNNLPFSNKSGAGFENKIAEVVAKSLDAKIRYVWWAQRRGYARTTLNEEKCDLWPGVAAGIETVATTKPYYRSSYVFVSRADKALQGLTLDDPRLKTLSIGVQMIGADAMNTPPAHALARRGFVDNVRGYMLYGDYAHPNPPADIVLAVARGDVDVALVWGPLAGFFASASKVPLRIQPVTPSPDGALWPMTFAISMGVRRGNSALLDQVEDALSQQRVAIDEILRAYHVPRV
jgi:mxaJ protein